MFIISLTYTKPVEEVDKHIKGHYEYIDKYVKAGKFLLTGRKVPRTGGVILCEASSLEEVRSIIREDPFTIHEIGDIEITEFAPTVSAGPFEGIL